MCKQAFLFILIFVTGASKLFAQVTEKDFDFLSKYYNGQYKNLINARGIDTSTYFSSKYLSQNDPSKIADVLRKYYGGSNVKIGALIYFYLDSTFHVFLANTEKVIKLSERRISQVELLGLNNAIIRSLQVDKKLQNRAPQTRGAIIEGTAEIIDFDSVNAIASKLLLPDLSILDYEHLIIVPCLNLGAFPYYLLKAGDKNLVDYLSYTVAASLIEVEGSCKNNITKLKSLNLGNPIKYTFEKPLLVANPSYPVNSKFSFPDLPGATKEIGASLKYFTDVPYTYYSGETATKKNILREFTKHDLLYFATHGVSSSTNPLDSCFLVLAGEKDAFLTNKEILRYFDSATKMDLVILSACQTALGKSMDAGIIGLSRAFQIAGANHVVMSLWNVDDEATAYLMQRFLMYIQMKGTFFPAGPLRKAILATKLKYPDPSKWGSFAVFGVPY